MWLCFTWSVFNWQIRRWLLLWSSHSKHHDLVSDRSLKSARTKRGMVIRDWNHKGLKLSVSTLHWLSTERKIEFSCSLYSHYSCQSLLSLSLSVALHSLYFIQGFVLFLCYHLCVIFQFWLHLQWVFDCFWYTAGWRGETSLSVCLSVSYLLLLLGLLSSQCLVGLLSLSSKQRTDLSHNQLQWFSPTQNPSSASQHAGTTVTCLPFYETVDIKTECALSTAKLSSL